MCDLRHYSKSFVQEFIEIYKNSSCLWNTKSKEYNNKNIKNEAYDVLINKLREIEPEADRDMVIKKINSLRTAFRREFKKVVASKLRATSSVDIYEPRLWYYNLLLFIVENEDQNKIALEFIAEDDLKINSDNNESQDEYLEISKDSITLKEEDIDEDDLSSIEPPVKKNKLSTSFSCNTTCNGLSQSDESCDIFGRIVASKLRDMPKMQRIIAEKMVNDVLFYGELQELTPNLARKFSYFMENINST